MAAWRGITEVGVAPHDPHPALQRGVELDAKLDQRPAVLVSDNRRRVLFQYRAHRRDVMQQHLCVPRSSLLLRDCPLPQSPCRPRAVPCPPAVESEKRQGLSRTRISWPPAVDARSRREREAISSLLDFRNRARAPVHARPLEPQSKVNF